MIASYCNLHTSPPPSRGRWRGNPRRRGCNSRGMSGKTFRAAPPPPAITRAPPPRRGREGELVSTSRLFVEGDLAAGAEAALDDAQAHYLRNVMRRVDG